MAAVNVVNTDDKHVNGGNSNAADGEQVSR